MFYYLFYYLQKFFSPFRVFQYISFRAALAAISAMLISILLGPWVIKKLYQLKIGEQIRKDECPPLHAIHKNKQGTPTMGGILIILSIIIPAVLWVDILNIFAIMVIGATLWLGLLGARDDYLKIKNKRSLGLKASTKFFWQILLALIIGATLVLLPNKKYTTTEPNLIRKLPKVEHIVKKNDETEKIQDPKLSDPGYPTTLFIPFYRSPVLNLGILYILLSILVIVGSSNAVNLTDGLDGLAIGCTITASTVYIIVSYITSNFILSDYLNIEFIQGSGELVIFLSCLVGAGLGFLWYNAHPAQIFMGDTGSLALGGAIGTVAIIVKKEFLLLIVGGIFVIEALSVILQVLVFKMKKRRIFLMAPIHHHFEMKGWPETKVTIRFWIIAIIFALISLASLKLQ